MTLAFQTAIASPMTRTKSNNSASISKKLLKWYDENCREMPWRVPPAMRKSGVLPNPYHVWLSEVMLQQTTVITVGPYFNDFLQRWPDVHALANAPDADVMAAWAGLGYYARARNLLKCARVVSGEMAGVFPHSEAELLRLPGIGPYTAAAICSIAFDIKATVLDGNIERVMARVFCVLQPLPDCKPVLYELAAKATPMRRVGDYAQAVMDLGATVCTPRNPKCAACPLRNLCQAHAENTAQTLPNKRPKPAKPTRNGIAYFAYTDDKQILLETRPNKGLLGGMLALPCSDWIEGDPKPNPPFDANWQDLPAQIQHVFTHFNLNLIVMQANIGNKNPTRGELQPMPDPSTLPTIMRKAYELGLKTVVNSAKSDCPSESKIHAKTKL